MKKFVVLLVSVLCVLCFTSCLKSKTNALDKLDEKILVKYYVPSCEGDTAYSISSDLTVPLDGIALNVHAKVYKEDWAIITRRVYGNDSTINIYYVGKVKYDSFKEGDILTNCNFRGVRLSSIVTTTLLPGE